MWEDKLTALVEDAMSDIVSDTLEGIEVKTKKLLTMETGTDDSVAYGNYEIAVNNKYSIFLRASAFFRSSMDHWDWASESHYTTNYDYEELQDFEYEIEKIITLEKKIDEITEINVDEGSK